MRKLRKNPETKQALGIEFTGGWDILNVAQALSLPAVLEKKLKNRTFHAKADLLHKHTKVFDRVLAQMFFWSWTSSGFGMIVLILAYFYLALAKISDLKCTANQGVLGVGAYILYSVVALNEVSK